MINNSDLTIVITSCEAYSDLWQNHIFLLNNNWINHPEYILVSDKISKRNEKYKDVVRTFDGDYSQRLLSALKTIDTKYVFLTLDDYLLCKKVNQERINFFLEYMEDHKIDYFRLYKRTKTKPWFDKKRNVKLLPLTKSAYEVNLYPSIWRKDKLISIITKDENAWKFEARMTRRAREANLLCVSIDNRGVFEFFDTIRKGKYLRGAYKFLKKNSLYLSEREIRTRKETIGLWIRTQLSRHLPKGLKKFLKNKSNKQYFSDCADNDD